MPLSLLPPKPAQWSHCVPRVSLQLPQPHAAGPRPGRPVAPSRVPAVTRTSRFRGGRRAAAVAGGAVSAAARCLAESVSRRGRHQRRSGHIWVWLSAWTAASASPFSGCTPGAKGCAFDLLRSCRLSPRVAVPAGSLMGGGPRPRPTPALGPVGPAVFAILTGTSGVSPGSCSRLPGDERCAASSRAPVAQSPSVCAGTCHPPPWCPWSSPGMTRLGYREAKTLSQVTDSVSAQAGGPQRRKPRREPLALAGQ